MLTKLKNGEFYRSLVVPVPLSVVEKRFALKHDYSKITVKHLIEDYIEKNTEMYEALAGLMLELMNSEVSLQDPNQERLKEFEDRLEKLDTRFKYVDDLVQSLPAKERKDLLVDSLDEQSSVLRKMRPKMAEFLSLKEEWNVNDALFLSYYDRYVDFLGIVAMMLGKGQKVNPEIRKVLNFMTFAYQVVIYAYINEKLNKSVMLRRYSELGLATRVLHRKKSRLRKDLVAALSDLSPPEIEDLKVQR